MISPTDQPIWDALHSGSPPQQILARIRIALAGGADIDCHDAHHRTPLEVVFMDQMGQVDLITGLLELGANPLDGAILVGQPIKPAVQQAMVRACIAFDHRRNGRDLIQRLCMLAPLPPVIEAVRYAVAQGAPVDRRTRDGETALHLLWLSPIDWTEGSSVANPSERDLCMATWEISDMLVQAGLGMDNRCQAGRAPRDIMQSRLDEGLPLPPCKCATLASIEASDLQDSVPSTNPPAARQRL